MGDKSQARGNDARSEDSRAKDLIVRGVYTSTPIAKALFVVLRSLEPVLQYQILAHNAGTSLLHRAGLRALPPGPPAHTGFPLLDNLGLSPYRLVLLGMSVGSVVKQNIWATMVSAEPMDVQTAIIVALFNAFLNGINNYAFLVAATSASTSSGYPQPQLLVGSTLYATGLLTELVAEVQRKRFKSNPENKGKPYTGGLWSLARHINYGAYTIWRAGYAVASGGWIWGMVVGGFFFSDFARRGVPLLNEYCEKRYGEAWDKFKKQTKYRLLPGIY